jgi:two-component system OmpR family response regulator
MSWRKETRMPDQALNHILYAEDESDIREIAKIALEDIGGFTVHYCANGKEVLEAAKSFKPDLLLLDVMMPEMDGPVTLQEIRKLPGFENIPVVFMTAKIQSNEIAQYKSLGALEVISKPFDPMMLATLLRDIWEKHKATL